MSTGAVLLAAGSGRRFGGKIPKQFVSLKGQPLFFRSLRVFSRVRSISQLVLVVPPQSVQKISRWIHRHSFPFSLKIVAGGAIRGESVKKGLLGLDPMPDVVLIHDTARALVDVNIIKRVESATRKFGAALAAWPLPDTLKLARKGSFVSQTLDRKNLWVAQTPQGFQKKIAIQCLMHPSPSATDDVSLVERKGLRIKIVEGSAINFKVTHPLDLKIAENLLS